MRSKTSLLVVVLALAGVAAAHKDKLAHELQHKTGSDSVNVIVQFKTSPTAEDEQRVVRRHGRHYGDVGLIHGMLVSLPANEADRLSDEPTVKFISPDRRLHGHLTNTAGAINAPYAWSLGLDGSGVGVAVIDSGIVTRKNLSVKKSDFLSVGGENGNGGGGGSSNSGSGNGTSASSGSGNSGSGDDGSSNDGGGNSRIVFRKSWIKDGLDSGDGFGHGTHVAGIIAGNGFNSTGQGDFQTLRGIAPNAQLIDLRVLDSNGEGADSDVIAAIETAIQLKNKFNIQIINLSLGRPVYESYTLDPLCQAVEAAYQAGIVVVVSAGNDGRDNSAGNNGYGTISAPGNDPYVITVGAMKSMGTPDRGDDLIATYSSKGPTIIDHVAKPDIVAPGNLVSSFMGNGATTLATTYPQNVVPMSYYQTGGSSAASPYFVLSGTSMAAPVVSGAAALLLQAQPTLTPDQVKARLMKTAYKTFPQSSTYTDPTTGITYTDQYDVFTVGAGYLDIQAALQSTDISTGLAKSPVVQYDAGTQSVYFVNDSFAVWGGSSPAWSSFAVWGGSAFVGNDFAVWGGSSQWASFAVWGGSSPWGDSNDGAFFAVWGGSAIQGDSSPVSETLINGDK
jgi:serine protease AprX